MRLKGDVSILRKAVQLSTKLVDYSNIARPYVLLRATEVGPSLVAQAGGWCKIEFEAEVLELGQVYFHQEVFLALIGESGEYELWLEGVPGGIFDKLQAKIQTYYGYSDGFIPTISEAHVDLEVEPPPDEAWFGAGPLLKASYVCERMLAYPVPQIRAQDNAVISFDDHGGSTFGVVVHDSSDLAVSIPYKPAMAQWVYLNLERLAIQENRLWGRGKNWLASSTLGGSALYSEGLVEKLTAETVEPIFETGVGVFKEALKSVIYFSHARESGNKSIVKLTVKDNKVKVQSPRTDIGERLVDVGCTMYQEFTGVYCADHLVAALDQFEASMVVFAQGDIPHAVLLEDGSTRHIIMGRNEIAFTAIQEAINAEAKAKSEAQPIPF